jgi:hypothetical protein
VAGAYDPAYFESLVDHLADAVRRSRARTEPAELGFVRVEAPGRQKNRVDPSLPTHDALSALVFRPIGAAPGAAPIAVLAVFGAHATVSHPVPPRLGGDYPAALVSELKRATGARSVLFASGAVGDASPARPKADSSSKSAEALGIALAGDLLAALPSARFARDVEVASLRLDVDLPPVQLPFFSSWLRFGPALTWWIADRKTHLHALRLGPAVLVGFPGDYSGHLADRLVASTRGSGLSSVATSFDGDFRGYLVSEPVFRRRGCYETRWMSFYGPWAGEYLNDLARRMVRRLSGDRAEGVAARAGPVEIDPPFPPPGRPDEWGLNDQAARVALVPLLLAAFALGCLARREVVALSGRVGLVSMGLATAVVLAFLVDPGLVGWSKVHLPAWLRSVGLLVGIAGLFQSRPGRAAYLLGMGCALLTSSWLVLLMTLRGRAVAWLREGAGSAGSHGPAASSTAPTGLAGHQS